MGVALDKSTMSPMLTIPATQIQSQDVQNGPASAPKASAAGYPADPAFDILLGQLLASVLQNGQQTPLDTAKLTERTPSGEKPAELPQAQSASQQHTDISKLLPGIQNQQETTNEEQVPTQFAELMQNIKGNAEGHDLARKASVETKGTSLDENAQPVQNNLDGENVFYLSDKVGKRNASLQQNIAVFNGHGKNDEGYQKAEPTIFGSAKTDFATIVQQAQSPGQHAVFHDTAAQTTDTGASLTAVRTHGVDSVDAFDHAVSIVKDGNRLAVQLNHNGLGKLDINLSLDKGAVNAQISVADDTTKKIIENNMQQIVNSILGDGVSVGGFSVSLRQQGTWDGSNHCSQDEARQSSGPALQSVIAPSAATVRGLVNIFI